MDRIKGHFTEAYEAHLNSGPTAGAAGYHGAAAAYSDDDSIGSITNSIAQMHMSNNANARALNDSNAELRQALLATQQQVAALARSINTAHQMPAWVSPPVGNDQYYAAAAAGAGSWGSVPPQAPTPPTPSPA